MMRDKPSYVRDIVNGKKTLEIRKTFPKCDLPIDVYIYCTKDRPYLTRGVRGDVYPSCVSSQGIVPHHLNGKVVAKFTLNKVEEHKVRVGKPYPYLIDCVKACLTNDELEDYGFNSKKGYQTLYAWHIDNLVVFDNPKELWQFKTPKNAERYKRVLEQAREDDYEVGTRIAEGIANDDECANCVELTEMSEGYYGLTRAPQSWQFVEVES